MLDRMIATFPHVAAFFYDKDGHEKSDRALEALETIDDDIQVNDLLIHQMHQDKEKYNREDTNATAGYKWLE